MNNSEKIEFILKILGIKDSNNITVIDELYNKISHIQKISEFNTILIQEMIKSDLIPPLILKKTQLLIELKEEKQKLISLNSKYEIFIEQKANKPTLNNLAKEILLSQNKIDDIKEKLEHL